MKLLTAYISHPDCLMHEMGFGHPECPQRLGVIAEQLQACGLLDQLDCHDAPLATLAQLARVHTADYIESVQQASPSSGLAYFDADTAMNPYSLNATLHAAGAVVLATELVLTQQVENAFCAVRPPGHHAESARAMGFCLFNNIAVGVAHALECYGLQRIAIVDFDVHHGNGTEEIFRNDERVMLCSTFQHPFYPNCGADSHRPNIVNVPLPAGTNGPLFREAIIDRWLPALEQFQPQMLFISAGFDAHREDDLAQLHLDDADYIWVTQQIKTFAKKVASRRIVSVLEGGYALDALGRCVAAHINVLKAP